LDESALGGAHFQSAGRCWSPPPLADVIPVPPGSGASFWVSAKAAADPESVVKWELFGETNGTDSLHASIREENERSDHPKNANSGQVAVIPERDCPSTTISSVFGQGADASATLPKLIAGSTGGIYAGTVTAVTPGFLLEAPAELLTVRVDETLRGAAGLRQPYSELYLFYGVAHFRIGSYYFCGYPSDKWGDPVVGSRVLVFVDEWARPSTAFVIPSAENQLILETKKGLYIPRALEREGAPLHVTTFDAAVEAVRLTATGAKTGRAALSTVPASRGWFPTAQRECRFR
jgi:hypothetical protein